MKEASIGGCGGCVPVNGPLAHGLKFVCLGGEKALWLGSGGGDDDEDSLEGVLRLRDADAGDKGNCRGRGVCADIGCRTREF